MSDYLSQGEALRPAWSGYWWPMFSGEERAGYINLYDPGGPLDKYDRFCATIGLPNPGAREFESWRHWADSRMEKATGYKAFWWGHCNGWSAASVLEVEPTQGRTANGIAFTVGDLKGLLTVSHNGDPVDMIRSLGEGDAHIFHAAILQSIGKERRALIFDTKLDPIDPSTGQPLREVWNYPAYKYECDYLQSSTPGTWDVILKLWFADDGVMPDFVGTQNWPEDGRPKVYTYRISGDKANPTSGTWTGDSVKDHPDLVWRPQPLSVQNAAEARDPGSSQESHDQYFHPAVRSVIYSIISGTPVPNVAQIRAKYQGLDLHWEITPAEAAAYPPPMNVGDFWRYRVSNLDNLGYMSRPFILHVECVGYKGEDWVFEVGAVHENEIIPERHVLYFSKATRQLSDKSPFASGYAYTLRQDARGAFTRSDDPALWQNSPLRRLLSVMPYAWERAGMEPVENTVLLGLGTQPIPSRSLPVGSGEQLWADGTVSNPRGNLRGMFLSARLDKITAELIDFGQKVS